MVRENVLSAAETAIFSVKGKLLEADVSLYYDRERIFRATLLTEIDKLAIGAKYQKRAFLYECFKDKQFILRGQAHILHCSKCSR